MSVQGIDFAHLSLLMDRVFSGMRVGTFVWRRRSGANDAKGAFLSIDHEYIICFSGPQFSFAGREKAGSYTNLDNDPRGDWVDGPLNQGKDFKQRTEAFYPLHNPETDTWYACDPDSVWRFASKARIKVGQKIRYKVMEDLVTEKRIKWPSDEKTIVYRTSGELTKALRDGSAPRNLRFYLELDALRQQVADGKAPSRLLDVIEPVENWVGRRIGYGKPRFKRFVADIVRTERPLSTWIVPAAAKKNEMQELDHDGLEVMTTGYTSDGTSLLSQMVGNKDFPYPKPLALVKALIAQSTGPDDLVVDFFAGSGTAGQAVLELNFESDADPENPSNRSFILVSSTEATTEVPDRNVCRDITRLRLTAAINGYQYKTKEGVRRVEGVGGSFGYLRARRISAEKIFSNIQHEQVWTALQLIHMGTVGEFDNKSSLQTARTRNGIAIYVSKISASTVGEIKGLIREYGQATIYSWQPALLEHRISDPRVSFAPIPQYLVDRFGAGVRK